MTGGRALLCTRIDPSSAAPPQHTLNTTHPQSLNPLHMRDPDPPHYDPVVIVGRVGHSRCRHPASPHTLAYHTRRIGSLLGLIALPSSSEAGPGPYFPTAHRRRPSATLHLSASAGHLRRGTRRCICLPLLFTPACCPWSHPSPIRCLYLPRSAT